MRGHLRLRTRRAVGSEVRPFVCGPSLGVLVPASHSVKLPCMSPLLGRLGGVMARPWKCQEWLGGGVKEYDEVSAGVGACCMSCMEQDGTMQDVSGVCERKEGVCGKGGGRNVWWVWFLLMVAGSCLVSGSSFSFNIIQYVLHSFASLGCGLPREQIYAVESFRSAEQTSSPQQPPPSVRSQQSTMTGNCATAKPPGV